MMMMMDQTHRIMTTTAAAMTMTTRKRRRRRNDNAQRMLVVLLFSVVVLGCVGGDRGVEGTVLLRTGNFSFQSIQDTNALFGPEVPEEGVSGDVRLVSPEDACSPVKVVTERNPTQGPWVGLVPRTQGQDEACTFDVKVRNVEKVGASAVIIYDDVFEGLILMSSPEGREAPGIPAVFISRSDGRVLRSLVKSGYKEQVIITPVSEITWISMLMSTVAGFFAMSLVMTAFFLVRQQVAHSASGFDDEGIGPSENLGGAARMTKREVQRLRLFQFTGLDDEDQDGSVMGGDGTQQHTRGGDSNHTCAICLEQYECGENIRELPCLHQFHGECIDEWLLQQTSLCPLCKWDAKKSNKEGEEGVKAPVHARIVSAIREEIRDVVEESWTSIQSWWRDRRQHRPGNSNDQVPPSTTEMGRLLPVTGPLSSS